MSCPRAPSVRCSGEYCGNGEEALYQFSCGLGCNFGRALTPEQILMAKAMTADPAISTRQAAEQFGIHRSTLYRHLNARQKRSA